MTPIVHLRRMTPDDLPALLRVQAECYPRSMNEAADILHARLAAAPDTAWVADTADGVLAYLFAYRSRLGKVTRLGDVFETAPDADSLYLHDLAVSPRLKGLGVGPALVGLGWEQARRDGLGHSSLVAVQASTGFWGRLGYLPWNGLSPAQADKLQSYDGPASYLVKALL